MSEKDGKSEIINYIIYGIIVTTFIIKIYV